MSDLIRRSKVVPVQARRADVQPETIQIPGAGPIPVPPQQPGVTQNIIYVNVPAGQPQQAPAPPPATPNEIHVHNHIHQYPKRGRGGRYGTSFLGTLGLVLGAVACGTCYVPQLLWLARFIAIAGVGCAVLGLLGSRLFRKNSSGMPFFGLIVSGLGYGLWMMKMGQLPKAIADVIPKLSAAPAPSMPAPDPTQSAPAPKPMPVRILPANPNATPQDRTRLHDSSIFGDGGHWGNGSNPPQSTTPTTPATPSTPAAPSVAAPQVVAPPPMLVIDSATAVSNLESARQAAARKLGVDYTAAKTAAQDAKTEYDQARATETPGSPELVSAAQTYLNTSSKLRQVEQQLMTDPAVATAEQTLKASKAAGK